MSPFDKKYRYLIDELKWDIVQSWITLFMQGIHFSFVFSTMIQSWRELKNYSYSVVYGTSVSSICFHNHTIVAVLLQSFEL